jgi:hypothetical protein
MQQSKRRKVITAPLSESDIRKICESPIGQLNKQDVDTLVDAGLDMGFLGTRHMPIKDLCRSILDRLSTTNYFEFLPLETMGNIARQYQLVSGRTAPLSLLSKQFNQAVQTLPDIWYTTDLCPVNDICFKRVKDEGSYTINTGRLILGDSYIQQVPVSNNSLAWNCGCVIILFPIMDSIFDRQHGIPQVVPYIIRSYYSRKNYFTVGDFGKIVVDFYNQSFTSEEVDEILKQTKDWLRQLSLNPGLIGEYASVNALFRNLD